MSTRALRLSTMAPFAVGLLALLLTGHTSVRTSADDVAPLVPLIAVVAPLAAGMLLTRLVPARLPELPAALPDQRPALVRQATALVAIALAFAVLVPITGVGAWYGPAKVAFLLGGGWLVLRIWRASPDTAAQRRGMTRWQRWLAPVPAVVAWAYLSYYSPLAGEQDMSGYREYDRVYLIAAMVLTFLTASVTEELFYRVLLQTRLEALLGRWSGILVAALLFAVMHLHRIGDGPLWQVLAVIVVFNGGFGLFVGYLWSRYRNAWVIITVHTAVNALTLIPVLFSPR